MRWSSSRSRRSIDRLHLHHDQCLLDTRVTTNKFAYQLAGTDFPGYFGIFYQADKPTKNAKEADINRAAMEKVKGLKPWEILQKSFDRLK